jgi:SNF2 family DNA or RNA helicase
MPGYLGAARDFRERYEGPIARDGCELASARLAQRVRPFMLRRLKRQVAPELPPRLEHVSYCDFTETQETMYRQLLECSHREIVESVASNGPARSRMLVLNTLLRLRQVCCDPRLLPLDSPPPAEASAKLALFHELLQQAMDGGHRVLVFSQFVRMLSLLREHLEREGLAYCYLDGATRDRSGEVARFQSDAAIPVFLISLKAGGVGLNLTGADTVIHFDPWWNPMVEAQATDRAHRLGQTRTVTSYKLICRGTVEEKIVRLQERKRAWAGAALGSEEAWAAGLEWEEIEGLIEV